MDHFTAAVDNDTKLLQPQTLERYRINNPIEIRAYLNEAMAAHTLMSVRPAAQSASYVSRLFAISASTSALVLDVPRADAIKQALSPDTTATVEFTLRHVRITFEAPVKRVGPYEGEPSLILEMPESMARFQRRETFRVQVPGRLPLRLTIDAEKSELRNLRLHDLSCGGVSVIAPSSVEYFNIGHVFEQVDFILDAETQFKLDLHVRHANLVRLSGNHGDARVGFQFLNQPPGFEPALSLLVNQIARDLSRIKNRG